jgi:hypothetical protein
VGFPILHQDAMAQQAGHGVLFGAPADIVPRLRQQKVIGLRPNQHHCVKARQGKLEHIAELIMECF